MEQSKKPNKEIRKACDQIAGKVYLQTNLPPGAQAARNKAARETKAEILLFLDDDVDSDPNLIRMHLENYKDPTVHAVAGFYLEPGEEETNQTRPVIWWRPLTSIEKIPAF